MFLGKLYVPQNTPGPNNSSSNAKDVKEAVMASITRKVILQFINIL